MKEILKGKVTYIVGYLIVGLGVYQFFHETCQNGIATILTGAAFMGLRRAIGQEERDRKEREC